MKNVFFICVITSSLFAQQEPLSTQFWNNYTQFNPAMTGVEFKHQGGVTFRNQFDKVNDYPRTLFGNYDLQLNRKHSLGVNFYSFNTIASEVNSASLTYSYKLFINEENRHFLSIGTGLGIGTTKYDYLNFPTEVEQLPGISEPSTFPKLNVGLAYNWNRLNVGFGITQLTGDLGARGIYEPSQHYYVNAAYRLKIAENLDVLPRVMFRTDKVFQSTDFNLMATYKKKYSIALGMRNTDAFIFILQYDLFERLRLGYSYEQVVSKLTAGSKKATHEFVIGFQLKKKP